MYIPQAINVHAHVHNSTLQPFRHDCDLASHKTYAVRITFIHDIHIRFEPCPHKPPSHKIYAVRITFIHDIYMGLEPGPHKPPSHKIDAVRITFIYNIHREFELCRHGL